MLAASTSLACRYAPARPTPLGAPEFGTCGASDDVPWHVALTLEAERLVRSGAGWVVLLESWNTSDPLLGYALVARDARGVHAVRGLWSGAHRLEVVPPERVTTIEEALRGPKLRSDFAARDAVSDGSCYVVTIWTEGRAVRFATYEPPWFAGDTSHASGYTWEDVEPRLVRALGDHQDQFLGTWTGPDSVPLKDGSR